MRASLHRAAPRWHNTASQRKARGSNFMLQTHIKCPVTVTTSGWRGPGAYLLGISFPQSSAWIKELTLLLCPECVRCLVLRLIVPAFLEKKERKKLLGNWNVHRPGFLSGKWNPESRSQTSNHTFILFIHPHSGALPGTPKGGEEKWIEECVLGNQHARGRLK